MKNQILMILLITFSFISGALEVKYRGTYLFLIPTLPIGFLIAYFLRELEKPKLIRKERTPFVIDDDDYLETEYEEKQ